jgi:hypothetical protein
MNIQEKYQWLKSWYNENKARLQSQPALVAAIKADNNVENMVRVLYRQLFIKTLSGCGSCLADGFAEIMAVKESKIIAIMERHFELKDGELLISPKLQPATNANLTDALAIAYLKDNPKRKSMFAVMPKNVDELIGIKSAPADAAPADANPAPAESTSAPADTEQPQDGEKAPEGEKIALTEEDINKMSYQEMKVAVKEAGIEVENQQAATLKAALLANINK